jgi:hypothetical protein
VWCQPPQQSSSVPFLPAEYVCASWRERLGGTTSICARPDGKPLLIEGASLQGGQGELPLQELANSPASIGADAGAGLFLPGIVLGAGGRSSYLDANLTDTSLEITHDDPGLVGQGHSGARRVQQDRSARSEQVA